MAYSTMQPWEEIAYVGLCMLMSLHFKFDFFFQCFWNSSSRTYHVVIVVLENFIISANISALVGSGQWGNFYFGYPQH